MRRLLLALAFSCLTAVATYPQASDPERKKPEVIVQEQPGEPLRISSVETKWATPDQQGLEIYYTVESTGSRPIRAYAIRRDDVGGEQLPGGCSFRNIDKPGKILQGKRREGTSTWRPVTLAEDQLVIHLKVDFVEFTDGGIWGADTCQSVETLSGMRAGARAAKAELRKMLHEKGADSFEAKIKSGELMIAPSEGHPPGWVKAFRGGVNSIFERVRRAYEEGGLPDAEDALKRPFDTSEN